MDELCVVAVVAVVRSRPDISTPEREPAGGGKLGNGSNYETFCTITLIAAVPLIDKHSRKGRVVSGWPGIVAANRRREDTNALRMCYTVVLGRSRTNVLSHQENSS